MRGEGRGAPRGPRPRRAAVLAAALPAESDGDVDGVDGASSTASCRSAGRLPALCARVCAASCTLPRNTRRAALAAAVSKPMYTSCGERGRLHGPRGPRGSALLLPSAHRDRQRSAGAPGRAHVTPGAQGAERCTCRPTEPAWGRTGREGAEGCHSLGRYFPGKDFLDGCWFPSRSH